MSDALSAHARDSGNPGRPPDRGEPDPGARGDEPSVGTRARRRLAGFARTLRGNGFKIGLAETRDALAILASPAAARPASLKPALRSLVCATQTDWERFDDIFDAFWRGHGMRRRRTLAGFASDG